MDDTVCVDIPIDIIDDNVVESDEYFTIHLSSDNQLVAVDSPVAAVVQVEDDDCESVECMREEGRRREREGGGRGWGLGREKRRKERGMINCVFLSDATVSFVQSSYSVKEDNGSLKVCIEIDGQIDVNITVSVTSKDGSARGTYLYTLHIGIVHYSGIP